MREIAQLPVINFNFAAMTDKSDESVAPPTAAELIASIYGITLGSMTIDSDSCVERLFEDSEAIPVVPKDTRIGIKDEIAPELMHKKIRDWGF
jgi:hypothetical protein